MDYGCFARATQPAFPPDDVALRIMKASDLPHVRALHRDLLPVSYPTAFFIQLLVHPQRLCLVAMDHDRIVGFASAAMGLVGQSCSVGSDVPRSRVTLLTLGVLPAYRRRGIGRSLVYGVVQRLEADAESVLVQVQVARSNSVGKRFYTHLGMSHQQDEFGLSVMAGVLCVLLAAGLSMSDPPSAFLAHVFVRKSFAFAGSALLYHDYLITLSLEVAYVWDSPWTAVKALFLLNRYACLAGQTVLMLEETGYLSHNDQHFCAWFARYCAIFAVFAGESIRLLVVMRACAILRFKRSISTLASILYIFCAISILVVSFHLMTNIQHWQFEYLSQTGICFVPMSPNFWMLWCIPLFLDSFILVIVCGSLFRLSRWSRGHHPSQLIRILARDALMFYVAAMFNVLSFVICWTMFARDPRNAIPTVCSFSLLSVIGQRLVLNLRRLRARPASTRDLSREIHRQIAAMQGMVPDESPPSPALELEELGGDARQSSSVA